MDKKILIIIVLIVLVVVFGWFYLASNGYRAETTNTNISDIVINGKTLDEFSHVVVYTEAGFSPESLEIALGDTVTFVNVSAEEMWVASNFHPTHLLYSELDAKQAVGNGEIFEFTFDREGKWGYHNHMRSLVVGEIVVK